VVTRSASQPGQPRAARESRGGICMPSMSSSTEASAKSLPPRIGVTDNTLMETRLDSWQWTLPLIDRLRINWSPSNRGMGDLAVPVKIGRGLFLSAIARRIRSRRVSPCGFERDRGNRNNRLLMPSRRRPRPLATAFGHENFPRTGTRALTCFSPPRGSHVWVKEWVDLPPHEKV
jgi:hypothetical protein